MGSTASGAPDARPPPSPAADQPKQPSPADFVLSTSRGAYTTIQVRRQHAVDGSAGGSNNPSSGRDASGSSGQLVLLDWGTHLERLVRSLRAMNLALDGGYARYYAWLQETGADEPAALQKLLATAIRQALAAAEEAHSAAQHLMLIVVLPPDQSAPSGLAVRALAHPCGPPGTSPCDAVVLGGPRSVPEGKDSGWVLDRQPLERLRPGAPSHVEVLLCTQDGRLLEGLVTNLFIVTEGEEEEEEAAGSGEDGGAAAAAAAAGADQQAAAAAGSSGRPAQPVVWTAGVADGVVWGTVRARVLEACRALGYAVREEAPRMRSRRAWREAFLTNSLRLVQPVRKVACGEANVWGLPAWELALPAAPGPVTAALAAAVADLLPTCPAADL